MDKVKESNYANVSNTRTGDHEKGRRVMIRYFVIVYFSLVVAVGVLLGTGLVPDWGVWHSDHLGYRFQVEAFLQGKMALSDDPAWVAWDMVWANGGVQQVWGLGVPAWQLLFEGPARLLGFEAFPDRLSLGIALACIFFLTVLTFAVPSRGEDLRAFWKRHPEALGAVLLLALFPPFLALCRTRFMTYEEAAAYSYLAGILLFLATIRFARRPKFAHFLLVCTLAGLAAFVRPTLFFYGVATLAVVMAYSWKADWSVRRLLAGGAMFAFGGALLYVSNLLRFGSGFEFGHSLNLNGIYAMRYATRFDAPFLTESLFSAARELFASLFLLGENMNGGEWYEDGFVPGQSATHRWREFYFTTYDLSFVLMFLAAWGGWVKGRCNRMRNPAGIEPRERGVESRETLGLEGGRGRDVDVMLLWSAIAAVLLFVFYLRLPVSSSRYLLDFGPAFAVIILAFSYLAAGFVKRRVRRPGRAALSIGAGIVIWWGWQVGFAIIEDVESPRRVFSGERLSQTERPDFGGMKVTHDAGGYGLESDVEEGWPWLHLTGWERSTGRTYASVALFVPPLRELVLEVAPVEGVELKAEDYEIIQAKVGLEFLERTEMKDTDDGMRLAFAGPSREIFQNGIAVAFLGFTSVDELSEDFSRFRLLRVEWEEL